MIFRWYPLAFRGQRGLPTACPVLWPGRRNLSIYETSISTVKDTPEAAAWIPEPQFHQERPGHAGKPPPERPQAPDAGLGKPGAWLANPRRAVCLGARCA